MPASILIVDDHVAARTAVRSLLDWHDMAVCGEAENGKEAIEKVKELSPDLVLLDINMPVMSGIERSRDSPHCAFDENAFQISVMFVSTPCKRLWMARLRSCGTGPFSLSGIGF